MLNQFFFGAIGILGVFDASVEFYDQPGFLTLILVLFFIFFVRFLNYFQNDNFYVSAKFHRIIYSLSLLFP